VGRLDGRVAVVTGGANGIGRACCERFAREGAHVVVADVADAAGAETVAAAQGHGRRAVFVHTDAASAADNEALIGRTVDEFGGVDVLVTAAGVSHAQYRSGDVQAEVERYAANAGVIADPAQAFVLTPLEEWHGVLEVNLTGTFLAVTAAARRMLEQGRGGSIVTLASIASKYPEAAPAPYSVSKAGVWMLTKHAARVLAPAGIRVNAVGPGYIETNMTAVIGAMGARDFLLPQIPMGRFGLPGEVANAALFLASDESSYFTGEILHPDGGFFTD